MCSLRPPTTQQLQDLENSRRGSLKHLKLNLTLPAGRIRKRKLKLHLPCSCPSSMEKVRDGAVYCGICGLEKRKILSKRIMRIETDAEQLGRAPKNASVFRNNNGSFSRVKTNTVGDKSSIQNAEPHVKMALSTVLDNGHRFTKPCPECGAANVIEMFGVSLQCTGCSKPLGDYVFRWLPDCTNPDIRKMADLRVLGKLDGPEDNPLFKRAREIFLCSCVT